MRVLCFGDSNTYGYDPRGYFGGRYDSENRWTDLLARQTGWDVINLGANGREIPQCLSSLQLPAAYASEDVFLIMLGTNDLLQGATAAGATRRMEAFLKLLLPYHKEILLAAPPKMKRGTWVPSDALVSESGLLAEEYKVLAEKLGISFVDTSIWNIDLTFDGVHFTESGHRMFANRLNEHLK